MGPDLTRRFLVNSQGGEAVVTLKDVADAAGVSPSTASAALRGMDIVKPLTRRKVIRQAQRLHYSTNVSARALRSGRSGIFTLIVPDLENGYYARLANSLSNRLFARNLKLIIQVSQYDKAKELRQIQELRSSMCDGLFVCSTHNSAREIQQVANGLPVLLFDDMSVQNQACYDSIETPSRDGMTAAIRHLHACGRRRIGVVGGHQGALSASHALSVTLRRNRYRQALDTMQDLGMDTSQALVSCDWSTPAGRRTAHALARQGMPYDALCCMNDALALGVIRGLAECGLRVPEDVAVTGFDGIEPGAYSVPTLTTVAVDFTEMARMAISMMLDHVGQQEGQEDSARTPRRVIVGYHLLERESTLGIHAASTVQRDPETQSKSI